MFVVGSFQQTLSTRFIQTKPF